MIRKLLAKALQISLFSERNARGEGIFLAFGVDVGGGPAFGGPASEGSDAGLVGRLFPAAELARGFVFQQSGEGAIADE